jgi:hypothetical protein
MVYFVQVLPKIMIVLFEIIIFCNNNKSFPLAQDVILTFPQYRSKFNSLLEVPRPNIKYISIVKKSSTGWTKKSVNI